MRVLVDEVDEVLNAAVIPRGRPAIDKETAFARLSGFTIVMVVDKAGPPIGNERLLLEAASVKPGTAR